MGDVLPKGTGQPDQYYRMNDKTADDARTWREQIHIFGRMHIVVAYLEFFSVLMLVFVGSVYVDFWGGSYFHLGPPVVTIDVVIEGNWQYWLLLSVIAWDRVFAMASSKIVSSWRVNVVLNEKSPEYKDVSYAKAMFVLTVDHVMNFLRGVVMILFIYSQVDFALAFAIPDIVLCFVSTLYDIKRLQRKWTEDKGECRREDVRDVVVSGSMVKPLSQRVSEWRISPMVLTFLQLCELALFVVVFYVTGYFDTPYFEFYTPFVVFGHRFNSTLALWMFVLFVFADTLIATLYNFVTGAYIVSMLLNPSCLDVQDTRSGATFIYISKKIIGWVRVIFMLNFILSKFALLLAMFVADLIITVFFFHRQLLRKSNSLVTGGVDVNKPRNLLGYMPLSRYYVTIVSLVELLIVLSVAIPTLEMYNYPYFSWPPPLVVFDTLVTSGGVCAYLIVYTIIARVIDTMSSDITYPYIANVIGGCDPEGVHYDPWELVFVCLMYDSTNWLKRIVAFNFIYSNISLVLFQALADIGVSWIIIDRNLKYKQKMLDLKNSRAQQSLAQRLSTTAYSEETVGARMLRSQVYNSMMDAENMSGVRNKDF